MPDKTGRTTQQEKTFIAAMAATGDRTYAARQAGYSQPSRDAGRTLSRPGVQAEIARLQVERLFSEALPAAVDCLVSIIRSDKAPAGARVQAAKVVLDRTLGSEDAGKPREPHEMNPDELAKEIDKLTRIAAERATPVISSSIDETPETPGKVDLFA